MPSYTINAEGIRATVLPRGAILQSLFVKDKNGQMRDVVVGFDTEEEYAKGRSFDGAVIGRYGNRISNGTFTIDGEQFNIPKNEGGKTALHGGNNGYDLRTWELVAQTDDSVTLSMLDPSGTEGFPGAVQNLITYALSSSPTRLTIRIVSVPLDHPTPLMPTCHTYWNLSGFATSNVLKDIIHMPRATRVIEVDDIDIPTGGFIDLGKGQSFLDFTSPRVIGEGGGKKAFEPEGTGIDHAYVFDRSNSTSDSNSISEGERDADLTWSNIESGIRMSLRTNQHGLQVYTAKHQNGSSPVKQSQRGGQSDKVEKFGCIAVEPQDWIDGINRPEWRREKYQIYGPRDEPRVNLTEYRFDTI